MSQKVEPDGIPEISVTLLCFFMCPFGSILWSDDKSLKLLTTGNFTIPQDTCDNIINDRYNKHLKMPAVEPTEPNKILEKFVDSLNKT